MELSAKTALCQGFIALLTDADPIWSRNESETKFDFYDILMSTWKSIT